LAVVVQELVAAEAAGIAFTADPVTGDDTTIEINAAWGLGEAIVGGRVTPDTISVDRDSRRITRTVINTKSIMTQSSAAGTTEVPVTSELRNAPAVTDQQAARLADLALLVEDTV